MNRIKSEANDLIPGDFRYGKRVYLFLFGRRMGSQAVKRKALERGIWQGNQSWSVVGLKEMSNQP